MPVGRQNRLQHLRLIRIARVRVPQQVVGRVERAILRGHEVKDEFRVIPFDNRIGLTGMNAKAQAKQRHADAIPHTLLLL
jgi:hypothetical protein